MTAIPKIQDFDDPSFDPFAADEMVRGEVSDIYAVMAEYRRKAPVQEGSILDKLGAAPSDDHSGRPEFTVLSFEHVSAVLSDPLTYSQEAYADIVGKNYGKALTTLDPPEHTRYRRLFQKAFLPHTVAQWSQTLIDPIVNRLMAKFSARTEADLVKEFVATYPFEVIYQQLALPEGDGRIFHRLSVAQNLITFGDPHALEASTKLGTFFSAMITARQKAPTDDLASALINAEVDGEKLPEDIIVSFFRLLINAAGDTTVRGTSVLLTGLLQDPKQLDKLRADRSLMPQAIEEALRWESPVSYTVRRSTRDTVLGGIRIPKASQVYIMIGAANRDDTHFSDPDCFNILREPKSRNLGFGAGPHVCLGQYLARLEMTRAVNAILDRMPNLRLDPNKAPPVIKGATFRMPRHLHVKYDG
jgi:cytochrome P450